MLDAVVERKDLRATLAKTIGYLMASKVAA